MSGIAPARSVFVVGALVVLAGAQLHGAAAGGSFERIVGVGAGGAWRTVTLAQSGPRSEGAFRGPAVPVPGSGYVRLYPWIGGLPAVPGRYYPGSHVLCLYWHEPASNCVRLDASGTTVLSPFAALPLRRAAPTAPASVRYRSRVLREADGNIFAALELALERPPAPASAPPPGAVLLTVRWRGPRAAAMPQVLWLAADGVYTSGRRFALPRGPWCYLSGNLPRPSAVLIEADGRVCR